VTDSILSRTLDRTFETEGSFRNFFGKIIEMMDVVVDAGAIAVIQPGGSVRDEEVIAAANERGIAMVFTGIRHFRH
jgi:AICAR transformylase/IMP cyclohydrolase PurH